MVRLSKTGNAASKISNAIIDMTVCDEDIEMAIEICIEYANTEGNKWQPWWCDTIGETGFHEHSATVIAVARV